MEKAEKLPYKFRLKDFTPFVGYFRYVERNPNGSEHASKLGPCARRAFMSAYLGFCGCAPIIGGAIGLVKLLQK
jgi:hypothetical protein